MENMNRISDSHARRLEPTCVNWHIVKECNYHCKHCFAKFRDVRSKLPLKVALEIPEALRNAGCRKINIAGGEPLLYPHLDLILKEIHRCDITTSIVTNGSLLNKNRIEELEPHLDWIGLSLDSRDEHTQKLIGRGKGDHVSKTLENAELLKNYNVKIKINTVVTKLNIREDIKPIIKRINPERWKVFKALFIRGENEEFERDLSVSNQEFAEYRKRNNVPLENKSDPVFETDRDMIGSYWMIAPDGRFFDNVSGRVRYWNTDFSNLSDCISKVPFDHCKFEQRMGMYAW